MLSHNIFNTTALGCCETPSKSNSNNQHRREQEYFELTPISPIKISFSMQNQISPGTEYSETLGSNEATALEQNDATFVEQFVELLKSDSDMVKFEAASSLLYLLTTESAVSVVDCGGVSTLVMALDSEKQNVRDECAKCIGKIAGFSPSLRDSTINHGGLVALLRRINSSMSEVSRKTFTEAVSTFSVHTILPGMNTVSTLTPQLVDLLQKETDGCLISEICKSLRYLCTDNSPYIKVFLDHGMNKRLMHLLTHQDEVTVTAALQVLRCLVIPKTSESQGQNTPMIEAERPESTEVPAINSMDQGIPQDHMPGSSGPNESPTEKKAAKEWFVSPLVQALYPNNNHNLCELDMIACQNVEIFKATNEDTYDREKEAGAAIAGQIGLRCIHCGPSPFARAQFSSVYPGSIGLLAASLRHMTSNHFRHCERIPFEARRRIHQIMQHGAHVPESRPLKNFFTDVCMHLGIENRYPPRSGLITTDSRSTSVHIEQMSPTSSNRCTIASIVHPMSQSMDAFFGLQGEKQENIKPVKYPLPRQVKMESDYTIGPYPGVREAKGIENQFHDKTEFLEYSKYFQDQHGLWRCSDCIFAQYTSKIEYAIWNGPGAPPPSFARKHRIFCPQLRAQNYFGKLSHSINSGTTQCALASNGLSIDANEPENSSNLKSASVSNNTDTRVLVAQRDEESNLISKTSGGSLDPNSNVQEKGAKVLNNSKGKDRVKQTVASLSEVQPPKEPVSKGSPISVPVNYVEVPEELSQDLDESTCASKEAVHYDDTNYEKEAIFGDLLLPEDKVLLTDYAHFVISMMKRALYQPEIDGKRRKGGSGIIDCTFVSGYPGIQCVYCVNGKNPRKFFYTKCDRLTNSFSEVCTHLEKCRYCPPSVKARLKNLKQLRHENRKHLRRGSHALFFRKMWSRMHSKTVSGEDNSLSSPGVLCLACPEDKDWLSEAECLTRKNIEVFCATEKESVDWKELYPDVPVGVGQVGLRCLSCAESNQARADTNAVVFPQTIENIRTCVRDLQEKHFVTCSLIPSGTRTELKKLRLNNSPFKLVKEYYTGSAKRIGLYDTSAGIFLEQPKNKKSKTDSLPQPPIEKMSALPQSSFDEIVPKRTVLQSPKQRTEANSLAKLGSFDKISQHNIFPPSSSFDEALPKPSLDLYSGDEETKVDEILRHKEIQSHNTRNQLVHNNFVTFEPSISSVMNGKSTSSTHLSANAVTPCTAGTKRKHDNITEGLDINYQSTIDSTEHYEL